MMVIRFNKATQWLLVSLLFIVCGQVVFAESDQGKANILIVKSYDSKTYSRVEARFRNELGSLADCHACSLEKFKFKTDLIENCLSEKQFNLIVTLGTHATKLVLEQVHDIPVLAGLIIRPDNIKGFDNATGIYLEFSVNKQLNWMKNVFGSNIRIGVICNPVENQKRLDLLVELAPKFGNQIVSRAVYRPQELPAALDDMATSADVLLGLPDRIVYNSKTARQVMLFSFRRNIPFVAPSGNWVEAGALYALDWDLEDLGIQCSQMAKKIIQSGSVHGIYPEEARTERLVFNLKTAEQLSFNVPSIVYKEAREFVEE